jgi:hypothetical protein
MDTSYLTSQIATIIAQLHTLFDDIGVPSHERNSRESEASQSFHILSLSLEDQLYSPNGMPTDGLTRPNSSLRLFQKPCTTISGRSLRKSLTPSFFGRWAFLGRREPPCPHCIPNAAWDPANEIPCENLGVSSEKNELTEEGHRIIQAIKQMEASLEDGNTLNERAGSSDLQITFPLAQCLQTLKQKHTALSKLHRERFEQVKSASIPTEERRRGVHPQNIRFWRTEPPSILF